MKKLSKFIDNHKFLVIIIFIFVFYAGTIVSLYFHKTYFAIGLFFFSMVFTLVYVENYYKTAMRNGRLEYYIHLKKQVDYLKQAYDAAPDDIGVKAWYEASNWALNEYEAIVGIPENKQNKNNENQ